MTWFITEPDGTRTRMPICSGDWRPSAFWIVACLHDPVGPICRRHKRFFRERKANTYVSINPADPHSQIRTTSEPCRLHSQHKPTSHINHRHHVWPLGEGGPNISDNIIVVCPTGHVNIHDLLNHYKMLMGSVPFSILKNYAVEERKYAKLGYDRLVRKEM